MNREYSIVLVINSLSRSPIVRIVRIQDTTVETPESIVLNDNPNEVLP